MSRRLARETALQVLYELDLCQSSEDWEKKAKHWVAEFNVSEKSIDFCKEIINGALEYQDLIDSKISELSQDWSINRMSIVDRNILRMAVYEMLYFSSIPQRVSINEAIELAKKYGSDDSAKFINGILDKLLSSEERKIEKEKGAIKNVPGN